MLDLLQDVCFAVRLVQVGYFQSLIDRGIVVVYTKLLKCQCQDAYLVGLRLHPHVIVTGVVPASN